MSATDSDSSSFVIEEKGMSLAEARETLWPLLNQHPKTGQPMGKLFDAGLLTEKDLNYLARKGHKPSDRKAAKILLLEQLSKLEETSETREPTRIISPRNWTYSEVMQYRFALLNGAFMGLLVGVWISIVIGLLLNIRQGLIVPLSNIHSTHELIPLAIILVPALIILLLFNRVLSYIADKINNQIDYYRKGRIGEELTARVIQQALNKNWSVFLNLMLPEKKSADMDAVLVGPPGIWLLEIKNMDGQFRNTGEQWEFLSGTKWKITKRNPTKQARKNAARLASFLKAGGIKKNSVTPVVVWVNIEKKPNIEQPLAAVWTLDSLQEELMGVDQQKTKFLPDEQKTIYDKLDSLYKLRDKKTAAVS